MCQADAPAINHDDFSARCLVMAAGWVG